MQPHNTWNIWKILCECVCVSPYIIFDGCNMANYRLNWWIIQHFFHVYFPCERSGLSHNFVLFATDYNMRKTTIVYPFTGALCIDPNMCVVKVENRQTKFGWARVVQEQCLWFREGHLRIAMESTNLIYLRSFYQNTGSSTHLLHCGPINTHLRLVKKSLFASTPTGSHFASWRVIFIIRAFQWITPNIKMCITNWATVYTRRIR